MHGDRLTVETLTLEDEGVQSLQVAAPHQPSGSEEHMATLTWQAVAGYTWPSPRDKVIPICHGLFPGCRNRGTFLLL